MECEQYGLGGPGVCKITGRFAMWLDCRNPPLCEQWVTADLDQRWSLAFDDFATQLARIEGSIRMAGAGPGCTYEPTESEHALLACSHDILAALNERVGQLETAYEELSNEAASMAAILVTRHPESAAELREMGVELPTKEDLERTRLVLLDAVAKFREQEDMGEQ